MITLVVRLLVASYRVEVRGPKPPEGRTPIFAFHHGRQLALLDYPRPGRVASLVSLSRDGSLQAMVLTALGFDVLRGSSSRGGATGLLALVRAVRGGRAVAVAVDGPRGPLGVVKPGVVALARAAGGVIVPVTAAAAWRLTLRRSWDKFMIPLPFSRVVILRGRWLEIPRRLAPSEQERMRQRIETGLTSLTLRAEELCRGDGREQRACVESPR